MEPDCAEHVITGSEEPVVNESVVEQLTTAEIQDARVSTSLLHDGNVGALHDNAFIADDSAVDQSATNERKESAADDIDTGVSASSLSDTVPAIVNSPVEGSETSERTGIVGYIANTSVSLAPSSLGDEVATKCDSKGEELVARDRERTESIQDFLSSDVPPISSLSQSSSIEARLLYLHREEAKCKDRKASAFTVSFCELFMLLPSSEVPRIRAILDSCLVFRPDGRAADLRSMVFEEIGKDQQKLVLDKINASCNPPAPDTRGFVVLSDVDDTLFPASDAMKIGGSDRSWHLDGRFYPGVSRLHRELRAGLRENYGGDYSVLLTARPPFLVKSTTTKTMRLSGVRNPRLAILPGTSNNMEVAGNFFNILRGKFSQLGQVKVSRMLEYAALFPEYAGRFVFIGDDGQGDFDAAIEMLKLRQDSLANSRRYRSPQHLLAFVAVHAVQQKSGTVVSADERSQRTASVRKKHPPIAAESSGSAGPMRHRFFYFDDYMDLAEQLTAAGWLEPEQGDAVMQAFIIDNTPDPLQTALTCDYLALRAALRCREAALSEADEVELQSFEKAKALLPAIERAHLRLAPLSPECTGLSFEVQFDTLAVNNYWDKPPAPISCIFQNIQDRSFSRWQWEAEYRRNAGYINLPWPCEALCHTAARGAIDIGSSLRCYVVLDPESSDVVRNGDSVEVLLLAQQADAHAEKPLGRVTIKVFWGGVKPEPMKVEDFFPEPNSPQSLK